jgi:hypothetical protein
MTHNCEAVAFDGAWLPLYPVGIARPHPAAARHPLRECDGMALMMSVVSDLHK